MECVPEVKAVVEIEAWLPATVAGLPRFEAPSWNWTVPVRVPAPGDVTAIVAVRVTFWPDADGLTLLVRDVVVRAWLTTWLAVVELPA